MNIFKFKKKVTRAGASVEHSASRFKRELNELKLDEFEACLFDGDYSPMIIAKGIDFDESKLQRAWATFFAKFALRIKDQKFSRRVRLVSEIAIIDSKLLRISICQSVLQCYYSPKFVRELQKDLPRFTVDTSSAESYFKSVAKAGSISKNLILKRNELTAELSAQEGSLKQDIDRGVFAKALFEYSKEEGYRIQKQDLTVEEYCILHERHQMRVDSQKVNKRKWQN